jgi:hypothetical protein
MFDCSCGAVLRLPAWIDRSFDQAVWHAQELGWARVSASHWLCPECTKHKEE